MNHEQLYGQGPYYIINYHIFEKVQEFYKLQLVHERVEKERDKQDQNIHNIFTLNTVTYSYKFVSDFQQL